MNLEDYNSYVNIKDGYTVYGYEGDTDHVFLYFYGQIYVKEGYVFPDIVDDIDRVQKIVICDTLLSRLKGIYAVIYDRAVISLFTMEYRGNMGEIRNQKGNDFEIRYYFKDFFAYYSSYNVMGKSSNGHFGFRTDSATGFKIRLVSNDLNRILFDKIK